jgi:hypothetical protein
MGISMLLGVLTSSETFNLYTLITILGPLIGLIILLIAFIVLYTCIIYNTKSILFKRMIYNFTHWGLVKSGNGLEFSRPWREFLKVKETKSFFLLYISKNDAHVIQKRMFRNREEIKDFNFFLENNLPIHSSP